MQTFILQTLMGIGNLILCFNLFLVSEISCLYAQNPKTKLNHEGRVPNDPFFQNQVSFYHHGGRVKVIQNSYRKSEKEIQINSLVTLNLPLAWKITTGSKKVIVAILDDGFFYRHEDIFPNVWKNKGESGLDAKGLNKESNGIDDDLNGYVDDVMGWDFAFDDPDPDYYVFDGMDRSRIQPYLHSIPALGIIGAKGNNRIGVAGINWDVSMMLLKIGAQGTPRGKIDEQRIDRAVKAIRYAAENGARVINWSGYVDNRNPEKLNELKKAIEYAGSKNVLIVNAVGNDGKNIDEEQNCLYPQCFEAENLIKVAELDFNGKLYRYEVGGQIRGSNFGINRVDIAALGANFSTFSFNNISVYNTSGGTSNAGPVVSGVAALILALRPNLTVKQLKEAIMQSVTPLESLKGKIKSGGVINAHKALTKAAKF
jgi:subtilisin family serine protease